jgi:hypothetical protein
VNRPLGLLPSALRDRARHLLRSLWNSLPSPTRLPQVSVDLHGWAPCWLLRLVAATLAISSSALVIHGWFGWLLVAAVVVWMLIRPGAAAAPTLVGLLGLALALAPAQPWSGRSMLLLLGLHVTLELCRLLGATSWLARVELRVLRKPGWRFVAIQAIAQLTGLAGAALTGRGLDLPWVPVLAAGALLLLAYGWFPRLARRPDPIRDRTRPAPTGVHRPDRWGDAEW